MSIVNTGLGAWGGVSGRVLLLVNSPLERTDDVAAVLERLSPADVYIIAPREWRPTLEAGAFAPKRIRYAENSEGRPTELNYFLEQVETIDWILQQRFDFVAGSVPHSLYNEEVKGLLEIRVGVFLGEGRFIAHALPGPFLYLFARADLMARLGRGRKVAAYSAMTHGLVASLHERWLASGRPQAAEPSKVLFDQILDQHLGAVSDFDELKGLENAALIPVEVADEFVSAINGVWQPALDRHAAEVRALRTQAGELQQLAGGLQQEVNRRDERLAALANDAASEIQTRDAIIASLADERRQAVAERDLIIDQLRQELQRLTAG